MKDAAILREFLMNKVTSHQRFFVFPSPYSTLDLALKERYIPAQAERPGINKIPKPKPCKGEI